MASFIPFLPLATQFVETMMISVSPRKGVGETTKELPVYHKSISVIKVLTRCLILIQYTIKENLNLLRLLDNLGLGYDIIVNKFDDVDQDERSKFRRQIQREITSTELKQKKNVFFLSAQNPKMFPDWLRMVDYLTEECADCK
ncbi:unnamed protein product [Didymodactylos carnosus]|uniref:Uncharacterized protein n=1 Tax=Didymodactylos carnosus TaxID=1234261 RepID=A0A813Y6B8_9BILA|nr:unnamed protein product [Didymodactylos carnosus]CAF1355115.1 unnamed protein product [Didymodactylos carnosus]CAF3665592.1 unnamed protein product [Didymodactylos carnosus]CAF4165405.1 unnamed protein product [Didymodactylos carnosus]